MSVLTLTPDGLRDLYLNILYGQYAKNGVTLNIAPGSEAYIRASAKAMMLYPMIAYALGNTAEVLPDFASAEGVMRHGGVRAVPFKQASAAKISVTVSQTGLANGTYAIPQSSLLRWASDGLLYRPDQSVITITSETGTITATSTSAGAINNRSAGDTLQWTTPPSTLSASTVTVNSTVTLGEDAQDIEEYRQEVILDMRERAGSGNRAHWREWVKAYSGVAKAFSYPMYHAAAYNIETSTAEIGYGALVPGAVTIAAVGAAQGTSRAPNRLVSYEHATLPSRIAVIEEFVTGLRNADGSEVEDGEALLPATLVPDSFKVVYPNLEQVDLYMGVETAISEWPIYEEWTIVSSTYVSSAAPFDIVISGHPNTSIVACNSDYSATDPAGNGIPFTPTSGTMVCTVLVRQSASRWALCFALPTVGNNYSMTLIPTAGVTVNPATVTNPRVRFYGPWKLAPVSTGSKTTFMIAGKPTMAANTSIGVVTQSSGFSGTPYRVFPRAFTTFEEQYMPLARGGVSPGVVSSFTTGTYGTGTGATVSSTLALTGVSFAADVVPFAVVSIPTMDNLLRQAVFDYFDTIGPSDVSPPARFPRPDIESPSAVRDAPVIARVTEQEIDGTEFGIHGVLDVDLSLEPEIDFADTDTRRLQVVNSQQPTNPLSMWYLRYLFIYPSKFSE